MGSDLTLLQMSTPFPPTTNPAGTPDPPVPSTGNTTAAPAASRKQQRMLVHTEREKTVEASPEKRRVPSHNQPLESPTRRGSGIGTQLAASDDEFSPGAHERPTAGVNSDVDMSPRTSSNGGSFAPPQATHSGPPAGGGNGDAPNSFTQGQLDHLTTLLGNHNVGNVAQILAAIQAHPANLENPHNDRDTQASMDTHFPHMEPNLFDGMTLPLYDLAIKVDPYIASTRPNGPKKAAVLAESFVEKLSALNISMNDGTWERFLRNAPWIYEGFPEEQRLLIGENTTRWILVIPFNGGSTLNEKVPEHGRQTMTLLEELGITVEHTITPYLTEAATRKPADTTKGKGKGKKPNPSIKGTVDKYAPPRTSAYKLHDIQDVLRLEALQTVDINPGIAVHFVRASLMQRSHFVCCIRVDQLRLSPKIIDDTMFALKQGLWNMNKFRSIVSRVVVGDEPTPVKMNMLFAGFELRALPYTLRRNQNDWPAMALLFSPIARAENQYLKDVGDNEICNFISSVKEIRWSYLTIFPEPMECTLCKSDSHHTFRCPYTDPNIIHTWNGPRSQVFASTGEYTRDIRGSSSQGRSST